jgi:hypothetical protein
VAKIQGEVLNIVALSCTINPNSFGHNKMRRIKRDVNMIGLAILKEDDSVTLLL